MRLRRVGLDQAIADVLGLELAVRKALPGVRIGDGLGLTPVLFGHLLGVHALAGRDHQALEARRLLKARHPTLEAEAGVDKHLADRARKAWSVA